MVFVPATVLGGLPVIAECWFSGPDYEGEYDSGVDGLYWQKRDGTKGKELGERVMERVEKQDYWESDITEQANEWLGCNCPRRYSDGTEEGEWSEEYVLLNGNPRRASINAASALNGQASGPTITEADRAQGSSQ